MCCFLVDLALGCTLVVSVKGTMSLAVSSLLSSKYRFTAICVWEKTEQTTPPPGAPTGRNSLMVSSLCQPAGTEGEPR
jgi:hypothetical protein